jgi:hypothetical protein
MARYEQLQRRRRALAQCELILFLDSHGGISRGWGSANGFLCFVGGGDFRHEEVPFAKQMIRIGQKHYSSQRRRRNGNAAGTPDVLPSFHNAPIEPFRSRELEKINRVLSPNRNLRGLA